MDSFELSYYNRRPPLVKPSATPHDFDFEDESLFDRVLGVPNKIEIPERYIPEQPQYLGPEEEAKRSRKAASICRILSKSSAGALAQQIPIRLPLILPPSSKINVNGVHPGTAKSDVSPSGQKSYHSNGGSTSGFSSGSNSQIASVNGSLPTSPVKRTVSIKKAPLRLQRRSGSATPSSSRCDWSLAGVNPPTDPYENSRLRGRDREKATSDYYSSSSTGSFSRLDPSVRSRGGGSSSWENSQSAQRKSAFESDIKLRSNSYLALGAPSHSYHSSVSSTSSSDREELLHIQHSLAREVTEKSRLVAVRALASSPGQGLPNRYSPLRPPTPPSPTEFPTIQQREIFFT